MNDEVIARFDAFKLKKAGNVKIMTLKIDSNQVVIDTEYPKEKDWADFMKNDLKDDEPRYVLLDHDYTTNDGRPADKIILVSWFRFPRPRARGARAPGFGGIARARRIPDTCPVRKKMTYSGTKEAVKSALQGIAVNINARRPRASGTPARAPVRDAARPPQATDHSEADMKELTTACTKI